MQQFFTVSLENSKAGGFESYRIPGIVVTASGTLLAYYETRLKTHDDWSARGIGLKRSTDGGKTWSERVMLVEHPSMTVGNPVMIAGKDKRVHLLWILDMRTPFYQVSEDDGLTFSEPRNILDCMETYREEIDWSLFAFGPGHGIELDNGRLLIPIWICNGTGNNHYPSQVSTISSDDGGFTWQRGEVIYGGASGEDAFYNPNETQAVQLLDQSVLLNIRHAGALRYRFTSISPNGKDHYTVPQPDMALPDPICFGSIVKSGQYILFVNCANNISLSGQSERTHLTIRLSMDDAKTWRYSKEIVAFAGYADISASPDGQWYYCFFEHDWVDDCPYDPMRLTFCAFNKEWLCNI